MFINKLLTHIGQGRAIPLLVKTRVKMQCSVCQGEKKRCTLDKKKEERLNSD